MALYDPSNFLHSLALYMASQASITDTASPRVLWRGAVDETATGGAADPYAVLRIYGGPAVVFHPQPRLSIQCMAVGSSNKAAMALASSLFAALCDATTGRPLQGVTIDAKTTAGASDGHYKIISVEFGGGPPGLIGRDEKNRAQIVFNFEIAFAKTT